MVLAWMAWGRRGKCSKAGQHFKQFPPLLCKPIADAGLRAEITRTGRVLLDFLSQLMDVDAHIMLLPLALFAPDRFEQLAMGDNLAGMTGQHGGSRPGRRLCQSVFKGWRAALQDRQGPWRAVLVGLQWPKK